MSKYRYFVKYPHPFYFAKGYPLIGAGLLLCKENSRSDVREGGLTGCHQQRKEQPNVFRIYTGTCECAQVCFGGYADCSACNPPWYLINRKKGCTPTLYLTDILYLTISRLSFGQVSVCLFACWQSALRAGVLFADQPTAGGRGRTCPHGGHAHGRGARGSGCVLHALPIQVVSVPTVPEVVGL